MFQCGRMTAALFIAALTIGCDSTPTNPTQSGQESTTSQLAESCVQNREAYLNLAFEVFDQDISDGWRGIASTKGCELTAANLIKDYRAEHQTTLKIRLKRMATLHWHEGQLRAQSNQTSQAIELFKKSYSPDSSPEWVPYVEATIAFLEKDMGALERARDRLISVPEPDGWDEDVAEMKAKFNMTMTWPPNLNVVTGLINCFDKTYLEAYTKECSQLKPPAERKDQ